MTLLIPATIAATSVAGVAPAVASWRLHATTRASVAYNQGITVDPARGKFLFDGVTSTTNSGLYRTNSKLSQTAANGAVIPATEERYNHAGDLSFDAVRRRILLPLECYYPASGGNTCGTGAIAVPDPITLRFLYYVNLDRGEIAKAMWTEISPDGRWIWTSRGTHLLVFRATEVNRSTASRQRAQKIGGITGKDLGAVLPTGSVTGAAFNKDTRTHGVRLLLALNRGSHSEVISYRVSVGNRSPKLPGRTPTIETRIARSSSANDSEGLAVTGRGSKGNPLGGVLHGQVLPLITPSIVYSRIFNYVPCGPSM